MPRRERVANRRTDEAKATIFASANVAVGALADAAQLHLGKAERLQEARINEFRASMRLLRIDDVVKARQPG